MTLIDSIRPKRIYEPEDCGVEDLFPPVQKKNPPKGLGELFPDTLNVFNDDVVWPPEQLLLEQMTNKSMTISKAGPLPKTPELEAPKKPLSGALKEAVESRAFNITLPRAENIVHLTDSELEKFVMVFLQFLLDFNLDKTELQHATILQDKKLMKAIYDELRAAGLKIEEGQKVSGVLQGIGIAFSVGSLLAGGLTLLGGLLGLFTGGVGTAVGLALGVLTALSGIGGAGASATQFYFDDKTKQHQALSVIHRHGRETHQNLVKSGADKFSKTNKDRHEIIAKMIEDLERRQEMLKRTKIA